MSSPFLCRREKNAIIIEKWGRPSEKVPEAVQKVVMSKHGDDALVHITGAPLVMHAAIPERKHRLVLERDLLGQIKLAGNVRVVDRTILLGRFIKTVEDEAGTQISASF
ncbi:uncharacterized protein P174DRAFT_445432 [Aspergillus novofumigatus IBT 16806]|uniref:Uncharacterized protein n=1 Tax=Aspergillus novofumigatus (strain IBT 16806) TaxID=1392255 RepID=A0A2I1BVX5_ASPN1|nr:uncharacterized protein P174DRAFT_445432 [Aspergillus novofumigatus IBT 16806]PKX89515.1 hypothetical protein P174DRAFT_445432 [Aspergillus novofumigatus IBT 16806]